MPNLIKMINSGQDLTRVAFLIAAYRHYLKYQTDDNGLSFEISEPWLMPEDKQFIFSVDPMDFLNLSAFKSTSLDAVVPFVALYLSFVDKIKNEGTRPVLQLITAPQFN